jgi:vacuolar-type H+-ATPase subunit I/STV1
LKGDKIVQSHKQRKSGEFAAVLLSVCLGIAATTFSHLWSVYDPVRANPILLKIGSWLPGWWGIGPYAGKETAGLLVWLSAWGICHWTIGRKEVALKRWVILFVVAFVANLIISWPTVYHAILAWPTMPSTSPGGGG